MTITPIDRGRGKEAQRLVDELARRMRVDVQTAAKQQIISDFCDGKITEAEAIQLIKKLGLKEV